MRSPTRIGVRESYPADALAHQPTETGWAHSDPEFLVSRRGRVALIQRFLAIMAQAENPGLHRSFGSTVKQLTGQRGESYWTTVLEDQHGHHRSFVVADDGRHGWSDQSRWSDRPRSGSAEISSHLLHRALGQILHEHELGWESPAAPWLKAVTEPGPLMAKGADLTAEQELHRRELRYGALMGLRIAFLLAAAILVMADVQHARWWILGCILGELITPWAAVMIANERSPHRIQHQAGAAPPAST